MASKRATRSKLTRSVKDVTAVVAVGDTIGEHVKPVKRDECAPKSEPATAFAAQHADTQFLHSSTPPHLADTQPVHSDTPPTQIALPEPFASPPARTPPPIRSVPTVDSPATRTVDEGDDSFLASQLETHGDVTWQAGSPITLSQATRSSRLREGKKVDLAALIQRLPIVEKNPISAAITPSKVGSWMSRTVMTKPSQQQRKITHRLRCSAATSTKEIFEKLANALQAAEKERTATQQLRISEEIPRADKEESGCSLLPETAPITPPAHLTTMPSLLASMSPSQGFLTPMKPPSSTSTPKPAGRTSTPLQHSRVSALKSTTPSPTQPRPAGDTSGDDLWSTDDELYDDSFVIRATQGFAAPYDDGADTPKSGKRHHVTSGPESPTPPSKAKRFTFTLNTLELQAKKLSSADFEDKSPDEDVKALLSASVTMSATTVSSYSPSMGDVAPLHVTPSLVPYRNLVGKRAGGAMPTIPLTEIERKRQEALQKRDRALMNKKVLDPKPSVNQVCSSFPSSCISNLTSTGLTTTTVLHSSSKLAPQLQQPVFSKTDGPANISISDDVLALLTEPDDILDSQMAPDDWSESTDVKSVPNEESVQTVVSSKSAQISDVYLKGPVCTSASLKGHLLPASCSNNCILNCKNASTVSTCAIERQGMVGNDFCKTIEVTCFSPAAIMDNSVILPTQKSTSPDEVKSLIERKRQEALMKRNRKVLADSATSKKVLEKCAVAEPSNPQIIPPCVGTVSIASYPKRLESSTKQTFALKNTNNVLNNAGCSTKQALTSGTTATVAVTAVWNEQNTSVLSSRAHIIEQRRQEALKRRAQKQSPTESALPFGSVSGPVLNKPSTSPATPLDLSPSSVHSAVPPFRSSQSSVDVTTSKNVKASSNISNYSLHVAEDPTSYDSNMSNITRKRQEALKKREMAAKANKPASCDAQLKPLASYIVSDMLTHSNISSDDVAVKHMEIERKRQLALSKRNATLMPKQDTAQTVWHSSQSAVSDPHTSTSCSFVQGEVRSPEMPFQCYPENIEQKKQAALLQRKRLCGDFYKGEVRSPEKTLHCSQEDIAQKRQAALLRRNMLSPTTGDMGAVQKFSLPSVSSLPSGVAKPLLFAGALSAQPATFATTPPVSDTPTRFPPSSSIDKSQPAHYLRPRTPSQQVTNASPVPRHTTPAPPPSDTYPLTRQAMVASPDSIPPTSPTTRTLSLQEQIVLKKQDALKKRNSRLKGATSHI